MVHPSRIIVSASAAIAKTPTAYRGDARMMHVFLSTKNNVQ